MKKMFVLFTVVLLVVSSPIYALLFLPGVGSKPKKSDRAGYMERASNYDGKTFHNLEKTDLMVRAKSADLNKISVKGTKPKSKLPLEKPSFLENPGKEDFTVTWFGHSSVLIQMDGKNILFDPVFSRMISPVSFVGVKRFTPSPVSAEELPEIDILILSHDHYDHMDYKVIKKLDSKVGRFVVPLGVECHLKKWGVKPEKITELAWWESSEIDGLKIDCAPAQHFSGRWLNDRNRTLWASWILNDGKRQVFENGDSGFGNHYSQIQERYGEFDFALMECGQYDLQWPQVHSFPEDSANSMKKIGAKLVLPIHWGSVVLARHGWDDSVERFVRQSDKIGLNYITPLIGETVNLTNPENAGNYKTDWWREIE